MGGKGGPTTTNDDTEGFICASSKSEGSSAVCWNTTKVYFPRCNVIRVHVGTLAAKGCLSKITCHCKPSTQEPSVERDDNYVLKDSYCRDSYCIRKSVVQ